MRSNDELPPDRNWEDSEDSEDTPPQPEQDSEEADDESDWEDRPITPGGPVTPWEGLFDEWDPIDDEPAEPEPGDFWFDREDEDDY